MIPDNILKLIRSAVIEIAQLGIDWVIENETIETLLEMKNHLYTDFYLDEKMKLKTDSFYRDSNFSNFNKRKPLNPSPNYKYLDEKGDIYIYSYGQWNKVMINKGYDTRKYKETITV